MTAGLLAMMLGAFGVPAVLVWAGHRLRARSARWRAGFWGAVIAHVVIAPIAMIAAMIPPAEWDATDTLRGALGLWAMLIVPLGGAVVGALLGGRSTAAR